MSHQEMSSLERVLTTLGHREPDRIPYFLLATMHGAKELGLSIREYFSKAEYVVEGQLRMRKKYRHDCLSGFFYGAVEIEAWGGEVIYCDDGPPNSGISFIKNHGDIRGLRVPGIQEAPSLVKVLKAIALLKEKAGDDAPVIGVVMSPFSLPVMQMGFGPYLDLIYEEPALFEHLMRINEEFCVAWANAQFKAGAAAVVYFDPVSSTTIIPRDLYLKTGFMVAKRTLSRIEGPTATHLASGRCLPIANDIAQTGTAAIGVSALEDLQEVKQTCKGKLSIVGNLNGIEMARWDTPQTIASVKTAIAKAGPGGGFILADNHGEIPWQVPEEVLMTIAETVHTYGRYPIDWVEAVGG